MVLAPAPAPGLVLVVWGGVSALLACWVQLQEELGSLQSSLHADLLTEPVCHLEVLLL